MDDLKELDGVGPAGVKALNAVGIATFAQLAGETVDGLKAKLKDLKGNPDFASWIADAAKRAPAPEQETPEQAAPPAKPVAEMSADELKAAASAWGKAQQKLAEAGEAAAAAQLAHETLPENASDEQRQEALDALAAAKAKVADARREIEALTPPQQDGAAAAQEGPADTAAPNEPNSSNTTESDDQGGAGNTAGPAGVRDDFALLSDMAETLVADAQGQMDDLVDQEIANARELRDAGDPEAARALLDAMAEQMRGAASIARHAHERLEQELLTIGRTVTCWVTGNLRVDGKLRRPGDELRLEPGMFETLCRKGLVSERDPRKREIA